ncbi:hypothetical protein E0Z10_g8345 [Xylaria hypoxylon]|uniref:Cell wall protein n=1 Tax=Xylaria hypoxylon TaxID=37992 RepID=A0A4Z0YBJ0_9PEZI|nr:hypothetical protein E0Z10_g8345 [Xylaria hypoxylon]
MKATIFLPVALAFTATAEMQLYSLPTPVKRDLATVTSVVAQISDAITQLDSSVKAFEKDGTQVQSDADNLVSTIKDGASAIISSGAISLNDALGLQDVATSLATAGGTLLADIESKKEAFQAAGLCGSVQSTITSIGSEVQSFVDSIVKQLPDDAQEVASQLTGGISSALTSGASALQCGSSDASSSSAATVETTAAAMLDSYPTSAIATSSAAAASGAVTVTVTAPCVCESTTSVSVPVVTPSVSVPYPTGSNSTSVLPTGAVTTTSTTSSTTTIATGGAVANGVGAVGLMAGFAAALFV